MANFLALFRRAPRAELVAADRRTRLATAASRGMAHTQHVTTPAPAAPRASAPAKPSSIRTVIDATTEIGGSIKSEYSVMVDGRVNGPITVTGDGHAVIVRATGRVRGELEAPMVMIAGTVHGDVHGRAVRILKTAVVMGRLASERVSIEMGATIVSEGLTCRDDAASADDAAPPTAVEPPPAAPAVEVVVPFAVAAFVEHPITPHLIARSMT